MADHYCQHCGTKLTDADRFCFNCGAPAVSEPVQQEFPEEPVQEETQQPQTSQEQTFQHQSWQIPAQEQSATPPVQPWKPEPAPAQPKPLPRRKGGTIFLSVLVGILAASLLLGACFTFILRTGLTKENVNSTLQRIDLEEIPAKDLFGSEAGSKSLAKWICQELNEVIPEAMNISYSQWEDITPRELRELLEKTSLLEFASECAEEIAGELFWDDGKFSLDEDDIADFYKDNRKYLEKEFPVSLNNNGLRLAARQTLRVIGTDEISLSDLDISLREGLELAGVALSLGLIACAVVFVILMIVQIFVINRKYPLSAIHDAGVVLVVGTILPLLLMGGCRLLATFFAGENGIVYLVGVVLGGILESGLIVIGAIFGLGVVLLLTSRIGKKIQSKKLA